MRFAGGNAISQQVQSAAARLASHTRDLGKQPQARALSGRRTLDGGPGAARAAARRRRAAVRARHAARHAALRRAARACAGAQPL